MTRVNVVVPLLNCRVLLVAVVSLVDISKPWNQSRLDAEMLKALYVHRHKQSVLVLNKVSS